MFIKNINMWLPFLVISLPGVSIKVMFVLYETGLFQPLFSEKNVCKIDVTYSLNV